MSLHPDILRLVLDLSGAIDKALDQNPIARDLSIGVTITSYGDHLATLYEDAIDFDPPAPKHQDA
ncbi:hypothetical protein [Puerhibacterium puerhi]|uniref:hypothetical protein n=1 Tax=Puerhibacterium puerhi TaxID=2692623 RepID=UPI00135C4268|nr:hypothetical protein [Puerhibacterium puerhi]